MRRVPAPYRLGCSRNFCSSWLRLDPSGEPKEILLWGLLV